MTAVLLAALYGLVIGSFLNVCIYRMPRDLSVVRPRSRCTSCGEPIAWYDNLPLLSYFLLRGRCRLCRAAISSRYPVVEALTAVLFAAFAARFGASPMAFKFCLFGALLVGLLFADLEQRILPDQLTLGGAAAGLALAWFVPVEDVTAHAVLWLAGVEWSPRAASVAEAVTGAALPSFFLWLGGYLYLKFRRREGLGFGDVKLMAMVGAFTGVRGALLTLILGSISGSVIGLAYIRLAKKDPATYELPFGTFLGGAGIAVALFGDRLLGWYAGL